jgi:hypothetical protein
LSDTLKQVTLLKDTDELCNELFEFEPELVMCEKKRESSRSFYCCCFTCLSQLSFLYIH